MRALLGGETFCPQDRAPKMAQTAQKISSVPWSMDAIRFRMCGAIVYEISRLDDFSYLLLSDDVFSVTCYHSRNALCLLCPEPLARNRP